MNGVSLREIGAEAGQRNTGAARYHFGSKEGLVEAVLEHRMAPINARRMAMLAEVVDGDLRGLAEAFVYPLSEQLGDVGRPSYYLRFVLQAALVQGSAATLEIDRPWTLGAKDLRRRFIAALTIPTQARTDRWSLFAGFVAHALADRERTIESTPRRMRTPHDEFVSHVIDAAVALAAAPLSSLTNQRRPA